MEVVIDHPYTETGQGHLQSNFLPVNLVNLPSHKSPGTSVFYQQSTTLYHLGYDAVNYRRCSWIQPEEAPRLNSLRCCRFIGAFDTVCNNNLLSKIYRSQLPPATARWLSCYLRGRQAKTCFRGVKSTSRKVNTGVPQGSKLSPSLFSFYIADMPIPTDPVCYADDITVWASGVNIPDLEVSINNYLEEITAYLKDTFLLISAPKSLVTLLTPDMHQVNILPLVKCPMILGGLS